MLFTSKSGFPPLTIPFGVALAEDCVARKDDERLSVTLGVLPSTDELFSLMVNAPLLLLFSSCLSIISFSAFCRLWRSLTNSANKLVSLIFLMYSSRLCFRSRDVGDREKEPELRLLPELGERFRLLLR
ncbi:hypothetical protein ACLKA6_010816 [Drosophila palustris]